jgi:hypothetical protein
MEKVQGTKQGTQRANLPSAEQVEMSEARQSPDAEAKKEL